MMGTVVGITVVSTDKPRADAALNAAFGELDRLEKMMSTTIPTSDVARINEAAGKQPVRVSPEVLELLDKAAEAHRISNGLFDVTVGPLVGLWGIGVKEPRVPSKEEIAAAVALCGADRLEVDKAAGTVFLKSPGMAIDLGGIAKGYAADRAIETLRKSGITAGVVAVAGDIRAMGSKPDGSSWRIGVQHPRDKDKLLTSLALTDRAVSTAGDYERFLEKDGVRYHHLLNPATGMPATLCQSATVVASAGIVTDPLSTIIFLLGPEAGMALVETMPGVEAIIVDAQGKATVSSGLKNSVAVK
ncbi:MAG: FAD:protein FMN transferase [Nitrospirota bacterium]|nr:FAD:protein FMN transferase [Nitrospirota bacterium]